MEPLPGYTPTPTTPVTPTEPVVHTYSLSHKDGIAWITLKVKSKAKSSTSLPLVLEGYPVEGSVELDSKDGPDAKSISVKIVGELVSEQSIRFVFAEASQDLWPASQDDALSSSEPSGTLHSLPFSLTLPKTIETAGDDGSIQSFRLPAPDYVRFRRFNTTYRMIVTVKHKSLLRPKHTLETMVNFLPLIEPPEPSYQAAMAYRSHAFLPAPEIDLLGWQAQPPIMFEGTLFGVRPVSVKCTFSVGRSLSFTRGTAIPVHVAIENADPQVRQLFTDPSTPVVRLRRRSHVNYDAGGSNVSGVSAKLSDLRPAPATSFSDLVDYINTATWWPTYCIDKDTLALQGEIHLRSDLSPSAHLGLYKLSYDVALFEPVIPGFVPYRPQKDKVLQKVDVEIATVYPPGPRPVTYSPPTYQEEQRNYPEETRGTRFNAFSRNVLS